MKKIKLRLWKLRVHNLKNVNVSIPRNKLVVFIGKSGSGKSSLKHLTPFTLEGQRRYLETFNTLCTTQFLGTQKDLK